MDFVVNMALFWADEYDEEISTMIHFFFSNFLFFNFFLLVGLCVMRIIYKIKREYAAENFDQL